MKLTIFTPVFFLFLVINCSNYTFAQNLVLSNNAKVSIITCDTGNESYSLFGHTAIRISDLEQNLDLVYNYGAFDFSTPNFVAKFSKGDLQYFATNQLFSDFLTQYSYERRSVYEQELTISTAYKQKIFDNLNEVLFTDQRFYTYKFIDKNCTSMVVDMVNSTLGQPIIVKKFDTNKTYRTILFPYFDGFFYEKLGTSIIFGSKVDQYGTRIFLPLELQKNLAAIQYKNQPLCKESITLLEFDKETNTSVWNNCYGYLIFLAFIIFLNNQKLESFYMLIMGLLGLFFGFMWFYSNHQELTNNYNLLLFNPLLLFLLYFQVTKNKKWILNFCYLFLLSLIIYLILVLNKVHLLVVLPIVITSGIVTIKMILKNRKQIPIVI
jgi:hypothetical protein